MSDKGMKAMPDLSQLGSSRNTYVALLLCLSALVLAGCKKHEVAAPDAAPSAPTNSVPVPANTANPTPVAQQPAPPPPSYISANAENAPRQEVSGQTDPFLTQQLQIYVRQVGRMPESFSQLAASRLDSIPRPPPGTKWVIDSAHMEVKAVPAK
jgi:hypothetical protein